MGIHWPLSASKVYLSFDRRQQHLIEKMFGRVSRLAGLFGVVVAAAVDLTMIIAEDNRRWLPRMLLLPDVALVRSARFYTPVGHHCWLAAIAAVTAAAVLVKVMA